jgi:hypothetical protein
VIAPAAIGQIATSARNPIDRFLSALRTIIFRVRQRSCQGFIPILAPLDDLHDWSGALMRLQTMRCRSLKVMVVRAARRVRMASAPSVAPKWFLTTCLVT